MALGPTIGEAGSAGVEIDATNQELADSANINLYTVSRIVSEWERIGAIRKLLGKILLRSSQKLFTLPLARS